MIRPGRLPPSRPTLRRTLDARAAEIDRTIVDLRLNGGGDSRIIQPLVKGLRDRRALRAGDDSLLLSGRPPSHPVSWPHSTSGIWTPSWSASRPASL